MLTKSTGVLPDEIAISKAGSHEFKCPVVFGSYNSINSMNGSKPFNGLFNSHKVDFETMDYFTIFPKLVPFATKLVLSLFHCCTIPKHLSNHPSLAHRISASDDWVPRSEVARNSTDT